MAWDKKITLVEKKIAIEIVDHPILLGGFQRSCRGRNLYLTNLPSPPQRTPNFH